MSRFFAPKGLRTLAFPVTKSNRYNAAQRPVDYLGNCTSSQILENTHFSMTGSACMIGNPAKAFPLVETFVRRSRLPFVLIEPQTGGNSPLKALPISWTLQTSPDILPPGNGLLQLGRPNGYLDLCTYLQQWSADHLIILHLGSGLQIGQSVINCLNSLDSAIIICDSVQRSILREDAGTVSPVEFMKQMSGLFVFSIGNVAKDLIEVLPTYHYERVTNQVSYNNYNTRHMFQFFLHKSRGISMSQSRTLEDKKSLFEQDELRELEEQNVLLIYNGRQNSTYLAHLT